MNRKSNSPPSKAVVAVDTHALALQLTELGVRRRQFIKARIRVLNAAGALVRRALGWQSDIDEKERAKIAKQAARIMSAENHAELPADLARIADTLSSDIMTARKMAEPGEAIQHDLELKMRRIARQFPIWKSFAEGVKGLSDLGLAIIVAEAGPLDRYSDHSKLWKRLGLAPITKDGTTRSGSQWRMKGGLSADDWKAAAYSPSRRAQIYAQVGNAIIGGMGNGYRPLIGEDVDQNERLSYYEKVFVKRLRYEAARDEAMRRPDTDKGRESYSKACAARAQYYTEKRLLKHLWQAWRKVDLIVPSEAERMLPSAEIADVPQGAEEATNSMPKGPVAIASSFIAPQGAGEADVGKPPTGPAGQCLSTISDASQGAGAAANGSSDTTISDTPHQNSDAPDGAGEAALPMPSKVFRPLPPRKSRRAA